MSFCLQTKIIKPEKEDEIKNAIILFHGYGGNGNDISTITINWKRFLPNTIFLCPNGHEKCTINIDGYQWFDLSRDDPNYILEQSLKAEKIINKFILEVKEKYRLPNEKICLLGFSQGCMMSINIGLTSDSNYNCIVGFSGKIINKQNLSKRISSKTKFLLMHGENDAVVPSNCLLEAKDFLIRNKIDIEAHIIKNCDHHISTESLSLALNYIKKNLNF